MLSRAGRYIVQKIAGEKYKAYIPQPLPPEPGINLDQLYSYLEKATLALGELNSKVSSVPNISLFIYMYVRKEALLSSQIEGTQSSFSDLILFEHHLKPTVLREDVEEVSNYVKAITYALKRLNSGFPLSLRLLREVHDILLSGGRGTHKLPGEFRKSQNWIGGTRPSNAIFVPPPVEYLNQCLSDFEKFMHDDKLPLLIRAGLLHVQFETIHPFLDGNGRLGRLLVSLFLCSNNMLTEPILYLSLYLKHNRTTYYDLLQEVRYHGSWETWLEFFLNGIYTTATQASKTIEEINALFKEDHKKIESLGRVRFSCLNIFEFMKLMPQVNVPYLSKELAITPPTARSAIDALMKLGILKEITGKKRDQVYVYKQYLDLLEYGTDPLKLR